eukprot:CAMPEP_0183295854 /NCGR_PEP_ID=MMETSP0160_2-20130417/3650_1 /TAXON_ID=2839 ORGANISM="Odontella Sinensis, Strain Grunow 1884" /NCGR_SAMPLE_ID=MMETSP0160_2 /ASSEMBLY_ACC=CAM_ASM_000250 /LENGTH=812 /DNA_ID=CAMNT_0025457393 /DNA_START=114 /DNA_END=2553 /DNA_ORIENTATION=+
MARGATRTSRFLAGWSTAAVALTSRTASSYAVPTSFGSSPASAATAAAAAAAVARQRAFAPSSVVAAAPGFGRAFALSTAVRGGGAAGASASASGVRPLSMSASADAVEVDADATAAGEDSSTADAAVDVDVTPDPKLDALRSRMADLDLDAYLVPSDDPHLSEYVPAAYMRRAHISGFTGSAGTAVVTRDGAYLWTDSRYFNEANLQLNADHWTLMKQGLPKVPTIAKFLADAASEKYRSDDDDAKAEPFRVGIDPYVHPASFPKELTDAFAKAAEEAGAARGEGMEIGEIDTLDSVGCPNLIDEIWGADRPPVPTSPFRVHPIEYAGMTVADKLTKIREEMAEKKATLSVFGALDDVAYVLNVRATGDVETCPVGIGYVSVTEEGAYLYCDDAKVVKEEVRAHLKESGVEVRPYEDIVPDVEAHVAASDANKVWIDKSRSNYGLSRVVPESQLVDAQNAVTPMKACKNKAELEGMRRAHVVDGAAMARFMAWLTRTVVKEGKTVSEVEIDLELTGRRAEMDGFIEVSFPTIAGVGPNGAIIHYRAQEDTDLLRHLDAETPILIDSGGQYEYGTTDVTRTWHLGTADPTFRECYTRVLKGNIGVDSAVFPEGTPGFVLDVFARRALWASGRDYGHGTGHGVGAALNVHEGPQSISPRFANKEAMKAGMVISNEPGYYEDGNFGIRIENLLEVTYLDPADDVDELNGEERPEKAPGQKTYLKFEKLTLIPIQKDLVDVSLMTGEEMDWLDAYHAEVWEKVSPLLDRGEEDEEARAWLEGRARRSIGVERDERVEKKEGSWLDFFVALSGGEK